MAMNPSSGDLYGQLQNVMTKFQGMPALDTNAISQDLTARQNAYKPQFQELGQAQAQAYAAPVNYMNQMNQQFGTQPGQGPSAMSRLAAAMNQIGQYQGTANAISGSIDAQKGRTNDMVNSIANLYGQQRQGMMDQYSQLMPLYQAALQREQAARAAASQANMYKNLFGGGGGTNNGQPQNHMPLPNISMLQQKIAQGQQQHDQAMQGANFGLGMLNAASTGASGLQGYAASGGNGFAGLAGMLAPQFAQLGGTGINMLPGAFQGAKDLYHQMSPYMR